MGVIRDSLNRLSRTVAKSTAPSEVRTSWASVYTISPFQIVLEDDLTNTPRAPFEVLIPPDRLSIGDRVHVTHYGSQITVDGTPGLFTRLATPGPWVACALGSGFTGSASVRKLSPTVAEFRAALSGSFVDGNTGGLCTLPAGFVPVGGEPRIGAYLAGAHPGMCYLGTSGIVGVNQRSGATRATLDARGTYGL